MRSLYGALLLAVLLLFAGPGYGEQWYKGGMHMHSLWSDGDAAPEVYTDWYKEHGWQFICYTDHNVLLEGERLKAVEEDSALTAARVDALEARFGPGWVELTEQLGRRRMRLKTFQELEARFAEAGRFLLIQGEELTTMGGNPHVNGIHVVERTGGKAKGDVSENIRQYLRSIAEQGRLHKRPTIGVLNHPNWSDGVTVEEALAVEEIKFFEVFNGHPGVNNWGHEGRGYPSTERFWDILLSLRLQANPEAVLYGTATDDAHNYHEWGLGQVNPGRGWVMVHAASLTPESLLEAMDRGDFYASTGVAISAIRRSEQGLAFDIEAAPGISYTTRFIGTRKGFSQESEAALDADGNPLPRASRRYSAEIGEVLLETKELSPVYEFTGDELYVRASVVSDKPHPNPFREGDMEMAWVQPLVHP